MSLLARGVLSAHFHTPLVVGHIMVLVHLSSCHTQPAPVGVLLAIHSGRNPPPSFWAQLRTVLVVADGIMVDQTHPPPPANIPIWLYCGQYHLGGNPLACLGCSTQCIGGCLYHGGGPALPSLACIS